MDVQAKWDEMCEAWIREDWQALERVGGEVQALMASGEIPNVGGRSDLGRGFTEAMDGAGDDNAARAKAGIEFVMDRFKRAEG